jgi:beta-N-acetylhexosaminidase
MKTFQSDRLTLEEKVGQLFFIGISGPELDPATLKLLDVVRPGGICLFARNIKTPDQTRTLLDSIRVSLPFEPFLSVDEEGGLVDRLRRILSPMPAAAKMRSADDAARLGKIIAEALRILGFNMDFAPVADVIDPLRAAYNNGLHSRAFGSSELDAAEFASRFLDELRVGGCLGCIKHFPGLGASKVDSHEELPLVDIPESELRERDLFPYRKILDAFGSGVAVMIGHAAYPNTDLQEKDQNGKLLPSSLSFNFVTDLLRKEFNFDGVAITDDLEMGAILKNYGIAEACIRAVNAGADQLAICADAGRITEGFYAVVEATKRGVISEGRIDESLARIARAKKDLNAPLPFDVERLHMLSIEIADLSARLNQTSTEEI